VSCYHKPVKLCRAGDEAGAKSPPLWHRDASTRWAQGARCLPDIASLQHYPAVRRQMIKNGFETLVYGFDGGPGYLTFSKIAYSIGYLQQQIAPSFIRPIIFAFGRKMA